MKSELLLKKIQSVPVVAIRHSTAVESFCPFTPLPKGSRGHVMLIVLSDEELAQVRGTAPSGGPAEDAPFSLA